MQVLVGCEFSGTVRDAFLSLGHDAFSCDLLPSDTQHLGIGRHLQGDVRWWLDNPQWKWDLFIVHPDCTYLTTAAEWAYKDQPMLKGKPKRIKPGTLIGQARRDARVAALSFFKEMLDAPIPRIAAENPKGVISTAIRPPDQWIQPYQYGHDASKTTGLWLKNLSPLVADTKDLILPRMVCKQCRGVTLDSTSDCPYCQTPNSLLPRWANQTDAGQNRLPPSVDRWKQRAKFYSGWAQAMAHQWGGWVKS